MPRHARTLLLTIVMACSGMETDGLTITHPRIALPHASVPDGVRMANGTVLACYVNLKTAD